MIDFIVIIGILLLFVGAFVFRSRDELSDKEFVEDWMRRHGYRMVSFDYGGFFFPSPFYTGFSRTSLPRTTYRVAVEDQTGARLVCWVRCGRSGFDLFSKEPIEVVWMD